jgi:hypothetical protein
MFTLLLMWAPLFRCLFFFIMAIKLTMLKTFILHWYANLDNYKLCQLNILEDVIIHNLANNEPPPCTIGLKNQCCEKRPWQLKDCLSWRGQRWTFVNPRLSHLEVEEPIVLEVQPSKGHDRKFYVVQMSTKLGFKVIL